MTAPPGGGPKRGRHPAVSAIAKTIPFRCNNYRYWDVIGCLKHKACLHFIMFNVANDSSKIELVRLLFYMLKVFSEFYQKVKCLEYKKKKNYQSK